MGEGGQVEGEERGSSRGGGVTGDRKTRGNIF